MKFIAAAAVVVALAAGTTGCSVRLGGHAAAPTPQKSITVSIEPAAPEPTPTTDPAELAEHALVSGLYFLDWSVTYDKQVDADITACSEVVDSEHRLYSRQREWTGKDGSGAGQFVWVLSTESGHSLAAQVRARDNACAKHRLADGTLWTPVNPGALTLPASAPDITIGCGKYTLSGHPVSYGCFTTLGVDNLLIGLYSFGATLSTTTKNLLQLLGPAAQQANTMS